MSKTAARKASQRTRKRQPALPAHRIASSAKSKAFPITKERFEAVMGAAQRSGLLNDKSGRIGGRVSPTLIEQAKKQTGIEADSDLIAFALANVALKDDFAGIFKRSRGKVDADLKLGY